MKKALLAAAAAVTFGFAAAPDAKAHNYLHITTAPAGYVTTLKMRVPHGCKGSPVNEVRIKIPEGMYRVTVDRRHDWETEVKMRKVDPPVAGDGGRPITETVDEIIWKNPTAPIPPDRTDEFVFRGLLPDEVGRIMYFRTINNCVEGDDPYVDLPADDIKVGDPDFKEKFWAFMTATATPAPYLVLTEPERPQYPWEWERPEHFKGMMTPEQEASAE